MTIKDFKKFGEEKLGALRIGVDLDENVVGCAAAIQPLVLERYGLDVFESPEFLFQEWSEIKKTPGASDFISQIFKKESIYREAKPISGAVAILNRWKSQGHQVWFITARPESLRRVTLEWLEANRLSWAKEKLLLRQSFETDRILFKAKEALRLNLHVFIEDQAEAINQINSPVMMAKLVLEYSWNRNKKFDKGTKLVKGWQEIDQLVQCLSQAHAEIGNLYVAQY